MASVAERCECNFVYRTGTNSTVPPVTILVGTCVRWHTNRSEVLPAVWQSQGDSESETDLVPVLSVATLRSSAKKRQHAVPQHLVATYSPGPRDDCANQPLCQREQRLQLIRLVLAMRQQHRVKMLENVRDSPEWTLVYDWCEPLYQCLAIERSASHHVPLAVIMRKLLVS